MFPTKNDPVLPQKERGFIRFIKEVPPPVYKLGLESNSSRSYDEDEPIPSYREKLVLQKSKIEKE